MKPATAASKKKKKKCKKKKAEPTVAATPEPVPSPPDAAPSPPVAPVAYNSCANPYWSHTLRCQFSPGVNPQENLGSTPVSVSKVKEMTRVFLDDDPSVRSVDGTTPEIYVSKAVCTVPTGCNAGAVDYGDPIDSDNWVITMQGGGVCTPPGVDTGAMDLTCAVIYDEDPGERPEMGTATDAPMKDLEGIHRSDPALNPVFAGYNRIRVEKSTYDRYIGRATYETPGGSFHATTSLGDSIDYDLYLDGFRVMEAALAKLQDGLSYTSWRNSGGAVEQFQQTLPPLADAGKVLFDAHSGGAHGLYNNIDYLHDELDAMPGFSGDVRALFDENFLPSPESEAHFTPEAGDDAYDGIYSGTSTITLDPMMFSFDGTDYYRDGGIADMYASWDVEPDLSCLQAHIPADQWKCIDRMHVLFNHISTPFMFREDFTDPNSEHLRNGDRHALKWGPEGNYSYCPIGIPCSPYLNAAEFRQRLMQQAGTLVSGSQTDSELATMADTTFPTAGHFPTFFAWMPDCGKHDGAFDDGSFYGDTISYLGASKTMREWVEAFMNAPALDSRNFLIDGFTDAGSNMMSTSNCG